MSYGGEIGRRLPEIEKAARMAGAQNRPPTNETSPDETEASIAKDATQYITEATIVFDRAAADAQRQAQESIQGGVVLEANLGPLLHNESAAALAQQLLAAQHGELVRLKAAELRVLASLNGFKKEHRIEREPIYPPDQLHHYALIFLLAVGGVVLNAVFFQNDAGLVGGAMVALGVSVVNVGGALLLGHFFTYKNHASPPWRSFGWAMMVIFVVWTIFVNGVTSAFRHYYGLLDDPSAAATGAAFIDASRDAVSIFTLNSPFRDFMSFILFFVGCGLAAFAFNKGYRADDVYPGYGPKHRIWQKAYDAWEPRVQAIRSELHAALGKARSDLLAARSTLLSNASRLSQTRSTLTIATTSCAAEISQIVADFRHLRGAYRKVNTTVRAIPAPAYFAEDSLPFVTIHDGQRAVALVTVDAAEAEYQRMKATYLDRIAEKIAHLAIEAAEVEAKVMKPFLRDVILGAEEEIGRGVHVTPTAATAMR